MARVPSFFVSPHISSHSISADSAQAQSRGIAFVGLPVSTISPEQQDRLPKIVVFSSYSTFGDIRKILPKLYESTWN
jgi:hypothetical protein